MKFGELSVNAELLDCDMYRLLEGDADAMNSYRGEYMSTYPWASMTEAFIEMSVLRQNTMKMLSILRRKHFLIYPKNTQILLYVCYTAYVIVKKG